MTALRTRRAWLLASALLCFAFHAASAATPQALRAYPTKPVRLIMGPVAGGPTDGVGRILAAWLSDAWGQPVIVDNRPGAGNTIATAAAAKATPDGYTLLLCPLSDAVAPALYKKLPYDFLRDITGVSHIGTTANIFVVHPSLPVKSVKEFIAYAKANPGKVNYGSPGIGQSGHLSMELLKMRTGIDVTYIQYKTVGVVMTDLHAGRIDAQITNLPGQLENVRTGKLRALAVTTPKRNPRLPEVPAMAESLPGFDVTTWYGICAPAGMSKPIVNAVNAGAVQALNAQEVRKKLDQHGVDPESSTPEQFTALLTAETAKWAKVVKSAGIPAQ